MTDPQIDVDYNVRNTVSPELFDATVEEYRQRSRETVDGLDGFADVRFDPDSTERLDVWGVGGALRPVFVAIHGGYWRALSRHHTAFMAGMLADAGIATVAVDYGLAPHTPLEEIVRQVRAAVAWVYHHGAEHGLDRNRIVVGGSSAGGHLTATTMVSGWQAEFGLPDDVVRAAMPISGLFDIRPLVDSFANEWLGLDDSRASALSPMLQTDRVGPRAVVAVAEHDGVGFLEQSRKFHEAWARRSESQLLVVPDRNHYDIFLDLAEPDSALGRALLGLFAGLEQA
ncbi:alpha/beta hydrolase fold domain-containing protein [Rhodococcus hoagii]|uniref:alpha/beta hydrolase n=1 Tax=Rhodococcus hoagii TaxID=43767 RepID=UPI0007CD868E|nr:alpha/beta hydrolase [Prescottella equi]MBM4518259.1 alpha/beta hydrolase fold domain-containing protein [Prescottella equi]MBM4527676.1 alpha/beta hydrolase fold domain-containing protein [Prescottella equi]MBM4534972.1 alpha/beta hydrolase fold domain-containing protein [Prescottella equi]MBM4546626.1 alpha/beta hydrolase fold domain-containing protein [Prescottella equi]MBM4573447.1 alpha/beta hydrolase fold domain-containing protein [Prescottella equi]